jgi:hypothetical protein
MRLRRAYLYATSLLIFTTACSAGDGGEWGGTISDSAGVTIVSNPAEGLWTEETRWTVEEDLRIGSVTDNPDYQFGQIGFVAVNDDGDIFATDLQAQIVKAFSPEGEYIRTIGVPGEGPGEIRQAAFVLWTPNDTLLVPDLGNLRVNRYLPDGSSAGSFPMDPAAPLPLVWRGTPSGQVVYQTRALALPGQELPPGVSLDTMDTIVQVLADGSIVDTLMRFRSGGTIGSGGEVYMYSVEPIWSVTDELKILYGVNDEYRFGIYSVGGRLERMVTKPFELRQVGERDKEAVMDFIMSTLPPGLPPQAIQQVQGLVHFAEHFPVFNGVLPGPNGSFWVQHIIPPSDLSEEELENFNLIEESGAPDWDVFDSEGRFMGVVTMPSRFSPRSFLGDKIYGVWRDELDVQHVMRLRITGL